MEKNPQWLDLDDESSMVFLKAHQNNDNSESRKKKFQNFSRMQNISIIHLKTNIALRFV